MLVEANSKAFPLNEEALRKWAKREGIFLHPEAAFLVKTQTMGMGVFAKKGIGKGQTVISCPHTAYIAPMDEGVTNAPAAAAIAAYRFNKEQLLSSSAPSPAVVATADASSATAVGAATVTAEDRLDDWTRTVLRLMAEVLRADSPWRTWLQCCPRMPDTLFDMPLPKVAASEDAVSEKKNEETSAPTTTAAQSVQQEVLFGLPDFLKVVNNSSGHAIISGPAQQLQDLSIEQKWQLCKPLLDQHPDIWPPKIPSHCNAVPLTAAAQQANSRALAAAAAKASPVSPAGVVMSPPSLAPRIATLRDLFLECAAQVTSRNFHRESQDRPGPYLLPTIDFLNHSADRKNVDFQIHGGGGGKRHVTFDVIATRDILPKEQIFHDYGSLSAARFLVEFQFVLHSKSLQADEGLRWSKEALSTLVALLHCNGNAAAAAASGTTTTTSFHQKYNTCLTRCKYLIRNDLFLFEEGVIMSGGNNEGVGGGDGYYTGNATATSTAAVANNEVTAASDAAPDLKSAAIIDYTTGRPIVAAGGVATKSGQESRSEAARRAERKQLEVDYLHNTLFLLSVSDVCFEGLKPFLSRHWTVMDIARNRREYEATGAGQRVVVELGCPLSTSSSSAASSSSAPPTATNADAPTAEASAASFPLYGAFASKSFRVGPTVLKEVMSDKLASIVTGTLTKPFIAAYEAVLSYQLGVLAGGKGSSSSSATTAADVAAGDSSSSVASATAEVRKAFPTIRTYDMTQQVLAHELALTGALRSLLTPQ